jgi:hypothetical protein
VGTNLLKEDRQGANLDAMDEMWVMGKAPCGPTSLVESRTPLSTDSRIHSPDVHLETMHPRKTLETKNQSFFWLL